MIRRLSKEVMVGELPLGGNNPIRLQSMTNTNTMDTLATALQCIRIFDAGGDYVRITTPGQKEAENLKAIKKELKLRGYTNPLIADIHYNPLAAEIAARIVEKVRINPGNYTDNRNANHNWSDYEYNLELEKIHERLLPLINICKQYGTAIRVGTNHGSLSGRIINRFGNTPKGMAESAMEFVRIFSCENFNSLVLSMKASNTHIMIESTRLLVNMMESENMNYPIHLGVTEAGEGEDGRIRSAIGIGTLLQEGIGDTIRVSLTEAPEAEIPVAKLIANYCTDGSETQIGYNNSYNLEEAEEKQFFWCKPNINSITQDKIKIVESIGKFPSKEWKSQIDHTTDTKYIVKKTYNETCIEALQIKAACDFGTILHDEHIDGIWIEAPNIDQETIISTSLNILQASSLRISKTEYVSCPSCGRTLYDIQKTVAEIKARTSHLKGLKIAIMGCIVNGPGEMAGADYGYVGAKHGHVTLYKGNTPIKHNIPEECAIEELITLIKSYGDWV